MTAKSMRMPEPDQHAVSDATHALDQEASRLPLLIGRIGILAGIAAASIGGEYCLTFSVVNDAIGPLPGEHANASPAVVSLGGFVCVVAFFFYSRSFPKSLLVRHLGRVAGICAAVFVFFMGLKLASVFQANMGGTGAALSGDLFGAPDAPPPVSLSDRFFQALNVPFSFAFGLLTTCNLAVAEACLDRLYRTINEAYAIWTRARRATALARMVNEAERRLAELHNARQDVLRELEPAASWEFACQLAAQIQDARAEDEELVTIHQLRRKPVESVLPTPKESEFDPLKLRDWLKTNTPDAETIYAAFGGNDKGKKKS